MQVLAYWLLRTATFLAIYAALWALRWFDIWAVLVAFVIGWALSYVAFPGMRTRAAAQMDGWISRSRRGSEADDAVEDAEADAAKEQLSRLRDRDPKGEQRGVRHADAAEAHEDGLECGA